MLKFTLLTLAAGFLTLQGFAQWHPAGDRIKTRWGEALTPDNVLPEYPRPIMQRDRWQNLNGLWNYAVRPLGQEIGKYDGEILVPFALESALSGVAGYLGAYKELWYSRTFTIPAKWKDGRILLHFGAVDWKADVWVNNVLVGTHTGGYTPFEFDITPQLRRGDNEIKVRVWDPTDEGHQPRGKQVNSPNSIWYTPVSGIWQTVWLEPVPEDYIRSVKITPDFDRSLFRVEAQTGPYAQEDQLVVRLYDNGKLIAEGRAAAGNAAEVVVRNPKLWSPDSPFLYQLEISRMRHGKSLDRVKSYAAMRKFSVHRGKDDLVRMQLNDKDLFQFGPLDQGWWPDGLYTAPTDEALAYDIVKTKDLGYNMIRKHVKVEPARWYYHCDRLGMIVWQDMPSGDRNHEWQPHQYFNGKEMERTAESESDFRKEWQEIIDCLYSYPCIGVWVPFNEAWGQFKTPEIAAWTKQYDPTRLVNPASGGNHYLCGDILDLHNYPDPRMTLLDTNRATVMGEYGGIGYVMKDHLWEPGRNWGYVRMNLVKEVTDEYEKYADMLYNLIQRGFAAAVYTQTTDVEIEVNGLMTYDRKAVKVDEERIRTINRRICNSLNK